MRFDPHTLRSTSHRFHEALHSRNLRLPLTKRLNTWAQLVVGKNHSAAASQAEANGGIAAVPLSQKRLQELLGRRGREVSYRAAGEILAEAIGPDLPLLSEYLYQLVQLLEHNSGYCLVQRVADPLGLGVVDAEHAGYFGVSQLCPFSGSEHERVWIKASAGVLVTVINQLAGYSVEQSTEIQMTNLRKGFEREDEVFADFVRQRVDPFGHAIAARLLEWLGEVPVSEWDELDYDEVRDEVVDFFFDQVERAADSRWLKPDCSLGNAVVDHLAAQLRETLRYFAYASEKERAEDPYAEALAHTAGLAMRRIVR